MRKSLFANSILIALIILENLFLFYFYKNGLLSQGKNAISLFLSSLLFGIVLVYKFYNANISDEQYGPPKNKAFYATLLFFLAGLVLLGVGYYFVLAKHPVSAHESDIIPLIQVICRRFMAGEYPYRVINDFGYPLQATYLPLQWMPFTVAELFHMDYRWVAFAVWCIAALWVYARSQKINNRMLSVLMLLLLLGANCILLPDSNNRIIWATVEIMIAGYYMLLISGLNQENAIIQGIFISCCLLSRYSLILWLPLYAFILFFSGKRKLLLGSATTVLVMVLVFYVLPFMSKDWALFYKSYKYYDKAALHEWTYLNYDGFPSQLYEGTGYAYYFYTRFTNLDIMERIKLMQKVHLVTCLAVIAVMAAWYWFNRKKINYKIFLLASFKIYLAFFLFLIQVPYVYLMITGSFVSIAIFCEQARYKVYAAGIQATKPI